jgi:hypothetical protein
MPKWQEHLGRALYAWAVLVSTGGTAWITFHHIDIWMKGEILLVPMSTVAIVGYVLVSVIIWVVARLLCELPKWDRAFYVLTAIPLLMMTLNSAA